MADTISSVLIGMEVDLKKLRTGLDQTVTLVRGAVGRIDGVFSGLRNPFAALGIGAGAAGLTALIGKAASLGDNLDEAASRIGIDVVLLQELNHGARLTGVGVEGLEKSLVKLNRALGEAGQGSPPAVALFRDMDISFRDASGSLRSAGDIIDAIADKIAATENPAERTRLAVAAFGREGARLIPLLEGGSAGLQKFREEAHALGTVMSKEAIREAARLRDEFDSLASVMETTLLRAVLLLKEPLKALTSLVNASVQGWRELIDLFADDGAASVGELGKRLADLRTEMGGLESDRQELAAAIAKEPLGSLAIQGMKASLDVIDNRIADVLEHYENLRSRTGQRQVQEAKRENVTSGLGAPAGLGIQQALDALKAVNAVSAAGREAEVAALGITKARADAVEQLARAYGTVSDVVRAVAEQERIAAETAGQRGADRIQAIREEAQLKSLEIGKALAKGEILEEAAQQKSVLLAQETDAKILGARRGTEAELVTIQAQAAEKRRTLALAEFSRVLAQETALREAVRRRVQLEGDLRAGLLSLAGRGGEAATEAARTRLDEVNAQVVRETGELKKQLLARDIDYTTFARLSVETERRAAVERIKIRRDEMAAIRDVIQQAGDVEQNLGLEGGIFQGLNAIKQLDLAANKSAQGFAALIKSGVSLDDVYGDIEKTGARLGKQAQDILSKFKNPLLQKAALDVLGGDLLFRGNLRPRIDEASGGLAKSSLSKDELRKSIGLVRDDLTSLNLQLDLAKSLFGGTDTAAYVGQIGAANTATDTFVTTAVGLDVAIEDIVLLLQQGIPSAVDIAVPALARLQAGARATTGDLRALANASRAAAGGGSLVSVSEEDDNR